LGCHGRIIGQKKDEQLTTIDAFQNKIYNQKNLSSLNFIVIWLHSNYFTKTLDQYHLFTGKKMHPLKHIFISYSHKDDDIYIKLLRKQLSVLERTRSVRIWTDQDIRAGEEWETKINEAIEMADLSILMISANFFESTFIQEDELPSILSREKKSKLTLFPVILEPCAWKSADWLSKKQARPQNDKVICDADDQTKKALFCEITNEINDILFSDTTSSTKSEKMIQTESQAVHCGPFVHLMCDRTGQVNEFRKSFLSQSEKNPKKPQFYVIHGKARNGHLSLVKRLKMHIVQPFANKQVVKKRLPLLIKPGWPEKDDTQDDLDVKMERLLDTLFQEIFNQDSFYMSDSFPAKYVLPDLIQSDPISEYADHAVLIAHRIPAYHWDLDLANHYISDFMSCAEKLSILDAMPLIIVFFNIEYPIVAPKKRSFFFRKKTDPIKEMEKNIRLMLNNWPGKNHCKIIKELQMINEHHVTDWFNSHQKNLDESEKFKAVDSIFDNQEESLMVEIEEALKKFLPA